MKLPTIKQKRAVDLLPKHNYVVKHAMEEAGYSTDSARNPQKNFFETKGVQLLLEQSGLKKSVILKALSDDIKNKPQNRAKEIELGLKLHGMLKDRHVVEGLTVEIRDTLSGLRDIIKDDKE